MPVCVCVGAWGVPPAWGHRGRPSSARPWGLQRLCGQAAALNQLRIFITAVHAGPRSWKAYRKGHIFNTSFNPTILRV